MDNAAPAFALLQPVCVYQELWPNEWNVVQAKER